MAEQHAQRREFERSIVEAGPGTAAAVHELWRLRDETLWAADPWFHLRLAEVADSLGQTMFAHDVLKDALRCFPDHPRITQRYCLSLIKGGFLQSARTLLTSMVKRGHLDEETIGILGRVHKEMWLIEGDGSADHPHLARARELYLGAFNRSHGAWSGINAASLSMIMGDRPRAAGLAREVIRICAERWSDPQQRDYWTIATAAEANLLLGRQAQAAIVLRQRPATRRRHLLQPREHAAAASPARTLPPRRPVHSRRPPHTPGGRLHGPPHRYPRAGHAQVSRRGRGCRHATHRRGARASRRAHRVRFGGQRRRRHLPRVPSCAGRREQRGAPVRPRRVPEGKRDRRGRRLDPPGRGRARSRPRRAGDPRRLRRATTSCSPTRTASSWARPSCTAARSKPSRC